MQEISNLALFGAEKPKKKCRSWREKSKDSDVKKSHRILAEPEISLNLDAYQEISNKTIWIFSKLRRLLWDLKRKSKPTKTDRTFSNNDENFPEASRKSRMEIWFEKKNKISWILDVHLGVKDSSGWKHICSWSSNDFLIWILYIKNHFSRCINHNKKKNHRFW